MSLLEEKMFKAISNEDVDSMVKAVYLGANLEARDEQGRTPLIKAACQTNHSLKMVEFLVNKGADLNAKCNQFKITALEHAMTGKPRLVDVACYLLDAGTNLSVLSNIESLSIGEKLITECYFDYSLFPCLERLINKKIQPQNIGGFSPLESVIRSFLNKKEENMLKLLSVLVSCAPCLVNQKNSNNWAPLHLACLFKQRAVVEFLVEHGADLNSTNKNGITAKEIANRDSEFGYWYLSFLEKRTLSKSIILSKNKVFLNRI